jgi:hypothetical protein
MKRYRVTLTGEEREELGRLLARGKADVRRLKHAQILLKADEAEAGPGWADERITEALEVGLATVQRLRRRFVEEAMAAALSPYRGGKRIYATKLDGEQEAHLIALACSTPRGAGPLDATAPGRADGRTSARRHALARDGAADAQKNELKPHLRRMWCIPPQHSAAFVAHMEDVLAVYRRAYDPKHPVVCLDETSRQLIGEVRAPLPPAPGQISRYDGEYVRNSLPRT